MEAHEEELINILVPQHDELKAAYEEHRRLKAMVDQLGAKSFLSNEEQVEKKDLQKRKLAEKDKIMRILSEHRRSQSVESHA